MNSRHIVKHSVRDTHMNDSVRDTHMNESSFMLLMKNSGISGGVRDPSSRHTANDLIRDTHKC